jgi:hypothetical protein
MVNVIIVTRLSCWNPRRIDWLTKQNTHTQQNARFTAYLHVPFKQIPPFRQDTEVQAKQNKKIKYDESSRVASRQFNTTTMHRLPRLNMQPPYNLAARVFNYPQVFVKPGAL